MVQRQSQRLRRSQDERMLGGVCGGLGEYFDVDPVLMRLVFVAGALLSGGLVVVLYVVLWILMPKQGDEATGRAARWRRNAEEIRAEARRLGADVREAVDPGVGRGATRAGGTSTAASDVAAAAPVAGSEEVTASADETTATLATYEEVGGYPDEGRLQQRRQTWAGLVLVGLGLWLLANNLNLLWWVRGDLLWPVVLLGGGAWLLLRQRRDRRV